MYVTSIRDLGISITSNLSDFLRYLCDSVQTNQTKHYRTFKSHHKVFLFSRSYSMEKGKAKMSRIESLRRLHRHHHHHRRKRLGLQLRRHRRRNKVKKDCTFVITLSSFKKKISSFFATLAIKSQILST
jgi:hypothetical protein